jgi:hypothetical protein
MDTSTVISLVALIVSILALPTSYFVAMRQVRVELDEYERRSKRRMLLVTANALQEFVEIFYIAANKYTGYEPAAIQTNPQLIDPHLHEIDEFVHATGVLERVSSAIDSLASAEYAGLAPTSEIVVRIQSVRAQIAMGSNKNRYASLGVMGACGDLIRQLKEEAKKHGAEAA